MHVFWMFNAANFAGDIRRGKDNHALLVALDPVRGEAAIGFGYGLEKIVLLVKPPLVESTVGFGSVDEVKNRHHDTLNESVASPIFPGMLRLPAKVAGLQK